MTCTEDQSSRDAEDAPREQLPAEDSQETTAASSAGGKKKKKKKPKKKGRGGGPPHVADVYVYNDRGTFKVQNDSVTGRCIVAARSLKPGELVLDEPPFAKVVRKDCAVRHCSTCCRQISEGGRLEAEEPYAVYCSRACKIQEDELRSAEAGALGKLAGISATQDVDLDLLRMILRLVVTRARALDLRPEQKKEVDAEGVGSAEHQDGVAAEEGSFLSHQWRNVHSLMHHRESMAPEWIAVVRAAAEDLMQVIPEWARIEVEEVVKLACRVNVNAHGLRDDSGSNLVIGVGLFPLTAMINHGCRPNCTFVYYGGKLEVRTLEPVAAGTELTVYYIDLLQSTAKRRQELLLSKHFLCACARCENPDPVDAHLDGVCCLDCGQNGFLTSAPPPSPDELFAAQLLQLGEDLAISGASSTAGGGKAKAKKKGNGDILSSSPGSPSGVGGCSGEKGTRGTSGTESDRVMHCSTCRRQYPVEAVEESEARAKASWDGAMAVLRAKSFSMARKSLEKWLEDYDAGFLAPSTAPKKNFTKKDRVKLHPANSMVVQTLVPLANCCNFVEDHAASARYLRRAISAMEAVYPSNYPELGDFHSALADAITALLNNRGHALPKRSKSQAVSERKQALERAAAIRSVCLGTDHPTTKEAMRALARA